MKKAYIVTSIDNCNSSSANFDLIKAYLRNNSWLISRKIEAANVVIINTCAVTRSYEDKAMQLIRKVQKKKNKSAQVIVTGCLPDINKDRLRKVFKGIAIGAGSLAELGQILNISSSIQEIKYIGSSEQLKKNKHTEYNLRIGWGCHGKCSYCAVKFVYGRPRSRPVTDILRELDIAYSNGYRKIILTGTDTGTYGEDINVPLSYLLGKLCQRYKECRFALSHLTPNRLKEILPTLEKFIRSGKIWRMYVPVVSGSDRIIHLMKRPYTAGDFKYCVQNLKSYNPHMTIITIILVGLPSETEEDFMKSMKLADWLDKHRVVISYAPYSKRPNTEASKITGQIGYRIKSNRLNRLSKLLNFNYMVRNKKLFERLKNRNLCKGGGNDARQ